MKCTIELSIKVQENKRIAEAKRWTEPKNNKINGENKLSQTDKVRSINISDKDKWEVEEERRTNTSLRQLLQYEQYHVRIQGKISRN